MGILGLRMELHFLDMIDSWNCTIEVFGILATYVYTLFLQSHDEQ